jgi:prevent-host-death family protein
MDMREVRVRVVGVRDLQQNLSKILDLAASGEFVRVTSRGHAKALVVPPSAEAWVAVFADMIQSQARAERGVREGWIRPSATDGHPGIPERGFPGGTPTSQALDEDRDE